MAWHTGFAYTTPTLPAINTNNVITVTNYGAVGDGVSTNTTAIQNAINQAAVGGATNGLSGGTVEIPGPGIYICGPLNMSNNVNLQVDAGVILRMLPITQYPGGDISPANFINGSSLHDIEVSGPGAIDGQGSPWWKDSATNSAANRPIMINFSGCNRLLIQNITLSNSPMFHMAIGGSSGNKTVQGVIVRAPSSSDPVNPSHNTDACDVGGTNILVQNCDISTGDDDFTCGGNTSDVLLTNNVYGTGHGVSIGSYTQGGVSNITVVNCSFNGTDNGIRLKSERGRGGLVRNLAYCNLTMTNVGWPLLVYSYYEVGLGTLVSVNPVFAANMAATNPTSLNNTTPIWQNITFSNITASMPAGRPPLMVWGLPEAPASNIVFQAINITSSSTLIPGVYNGTNVQFINCNFNLPAGITNLQFWDAGLILTNTTGAPTATNLWALDGLTTNGLGNALQFYNAQAKLKNTNALASGPLTLSASTFTVNNNLSLAPNTVVNFAAGTNPVTLAVAGNLTLGGTNNIYAGPGFTNGTYTLMTYTGTLTGSVPALGTVPSGYACQFDTNTAGAVKLVVTPFISVPSTPTGLSAAAGNAQVALSWNASSGATSYNVKRATVSGGPYTTVTNVAVTSYTDTGLANGTTYYYVVSAVNTAGESGNSSEANATPNATVFSDTFSSSSLNSTTLIAPTASSAGYQLTSSKSWSPAPSLAAGHLKFGIAATSSGVMEAQALFTSSPVTLVNAGDSLSLTAAFTNTTGLLAESGAMGFGLYNSGQNSPVLGGLNGTATSSNSNNATGNAQTWVGYVGQLSFTNASSQILTRTAQSGSGNNNQELVTTGSGSSSYNNPAGATVGTASSAASVVLATNSSYTEVLTITLTASNTLAITNSLYSGNGTTGALLSQFGGAASGTAYLTNSFDALAIGWRATASTAPTLIDLNSISVSAASSGGSVSPPSAPTGLSATAGNAQVALGWNASSGATSYNVKRATVNGGPYTTITNVTTTSDTDTGLTNGVTYYYVVSAVNAGGESANSAQVAATPILPSVPPTISGLTNQTVNTRFNVTLSATVSGSPAPALQWQVNGAAINGATNASLTLTNVQLYQNGYVYSLTATNSAGTAVSSMSLTVTNALFNVQINGLGAAYTGAGQIGSAGDIWNNPVLSNVENNGTIHTNTTTLASNVALVDSRGVSSTVAWSLSAAQYKGYLAASSGTQGEIAGLNNHSIEFDYDGITPPSGIISLTGLPANTSLNLFGYGATTYTSPIGSVWTFAAANGGNSANQGGPLSDTNGMNLTVVTNQGKCWIKIVGTTDTNGNLTVNLSPTSSSGGVWWQFYLNGFQLQLHTAPWAIGLTNQTVVQGNSATLAPTLFGTPTPTLQWQANGVNIAGATNASLTLSNIQYAQNGYVYSLVSSNLAGVATNSMTLTVIIPPGISGLTNQSALIGGTVTMSPAVSGVPAPSVQWQFNGTNLIDGPTGRGSIVSGSTSSTLNLTNAQSGDSGTYSVIASNSAGSATNSMTLTVASGNVPPVITGLANQTAIQGSNATFSTSVSGLPVPTLQWLLNGVPIAGATSPALTLTNVSYSQNGSTYSLVASNTAGIVTNGATLTVLVPAGISTQPQNLVVTNTQSAAFSVVTVGVPAPACQWYYNGSSIPSATAATYNIGSASPANSGNYFVVVSNNVNVVTSTVVTLTVNSTMNYTSLAPANGAAGVGYDSPLYLTFNSAPALRTAGTIRIFNVTNSAVPVDTIDLSLCVTNDPVYAANVQPCIIGGQTFTNFPVIITGTTAAIYPHHGLLTSNQTYYVTVDDGAFVDSAGAYFAGIAATNAWRFTTKTGGPLNPTNLVVAADGSGDFVTVQGAVDFVPGGNTTPTVINIHNGVYTEVVHINSRNNLLLRGQSRQGTIITYANNSHMNGNTHTRMTMKLNANGIALDNLTLTNSTPNGGSQAEALMIESGASSNIVNNCAIDSYQDTILANQNTSRVYFNQSLIQGNVDFIWGGGVLFFTNCEIRYNTAGAYGPNPSPSSADINSNGFSFVNCQFTTTPGALNCLIGRTRGITNANMAMINCFVSTNMGGWNADALPTNNFRNWYYNCTNDNGSVVALSNGIPLSAGDPNLALASSATSWLYGWAPALSPNIITNPASQNTAAGGNISLSIVATGIPQPAYQWLKNGTNMPGATGSTLTISGATTADSGNYSVLVSNSAGSVTSGMAVVSVAPFAPTGLSATAGNAQMALSWNASSGATSYNVKRATVNGGPYTTITNVATTSDTDTGLVNGTTYYYVVSALNAGGESTNSTQVNAMPQAAPSAPSGLNATAGNAQVALGWNASIGATSYNVKRATVSGGPYTTVTNVAGTTDTDTGLVNGTIYYYVVSALNAGGESANSPQVSATPQVAAPATPTGLNATAGNAQATLSWGASSGATSYNVKRATVSGGPYTTVTNVSGTSDTDTGLANGMTYYYVVSALNAGGESANSAQASATPADLFSWWKFDEGSGSTAYDSGGGGNNGTLHSGATWISGVISNAVHLDGTTNGYVSFPSALVSTLNDFSVSTWVKVDTNAAWSRVFDFGSGTGTYMFLTPDSGGNTVRYAITTNSSSGEQQLNSPTILSTGIWHHVAVTLSGSAGVLYLDGTAVATNTSMTLKPSSLGSTTQNYIGRSQWPTDPYLNGGVDDFRLYARALSASEVSTLAAAALPSPWATADIGAVAVTGAATAINGVFTVQGAGTNINGVADACRFVYQASSGDCSNTVRVASIQNIGANAKAGMMIRETLSAGALEAGIWVTPTNGIIFTSRNSTGSSTSTSTATGLTAPYWVRIRRVGNSFYSYYSADGTTWTKLGSTKTINMASSAYIGMGVESGVSNVLDTATMDNNTIVP